MVLEEADVYLFIGMYYAELLAVGKNVYFSLVYSFQVSVWWRFNKMEGENELMIYSVEDLVCILWWGGSLVTYFGTCIE